MDDLTITRLCAEALGGVWDEHATQHGNGITYATGTTHNRFNYDPLRDDAQCFALDGVLLAKGNYTMFDSLFRFRSKAYDHEDFDFPANMKDPANRRRARCLCVAKLQQQKEQR